MKHISQFIETLQARIALNKRAFIIYTILRICITLTLVRSILTGNLESVALCILSLVLFLAPSFLEDKLKIEIPAFFQIIIYLFIFSAEILGEINHYYVKIKGWDTMLHTMNGFLCAAIGFSLIDLLNRNSKKKTHLSPVYLSVVAFCFSMTVGVLWEFFECGMDLFFHFDMQKDYIIKSFGSVTLDPQNNGNVIQTGSILKTLIFTKAGKVFTIHGGYLDIGLLDTMKDLFVNFIGALGFSFIGYQHVARRKEKFSPLVNGLTNNLEIKTLNDEELLKRRTRVEQELEQLKSEASLRKWRKKEDGKKDDTGKEERSK